MFIKSFINSFYFIDYVLIRQIIKIHLVLGKIKEIIFIQKKRQLVIFIFHRYLILVLLYFWNGHVKIAFTTCVIFS